MYTLAVKNSAEGRKLTISISGEIVSSQYWDDETGEDRIRAELQQMNVTDQDTVTVTINSPGGNYFAAVSIHNTLKDLPCKVITKNMGLAASAASVIFMSGDERIVYPGCSTMVHDPLTGIYGNADDLRATADMLDEICESAKGIYLSAGINSEKLVELMKAETMMNPDQALEFGFATSKLENLTVQNCFNDKQITNASAHSFGEKKPKPAPKVENKADLAFIFNACDQAGDLNLIKVFNGKDFTEREINAKISVIGGIKNICEASNVEFSALSNKMDNPVELLSAFIAEFKADKGEIDNSQTLSVSEFKVTPATKFE